MERFKQVEDGAVITHSKGVHHQRKVYTRDGHIYAAHGTGFIMLYAGGATALPSVGWKEIDLGPGWLGEGPIAGALGRLLLPIPRLSIAS